jgi:mRNA-degrading endonuclease toxin of MazEF toxin-antitoxin module
MLRLTTPRRSIPTAVLKSSDRTQVLTREIDRHWKNCRHPRRSLPFRTTDGSSLMVDKIATVRRSKLGERVERLSSEDTVRLDRSVVVFLGLAG